MKRPWRIWLDRRGRLSPLRIGTLALLLFPLSKAIFQAVEIAHGARPINDLIHRAGFWALIFLGVTLAVTPFRRIARFGQLVDVWCMLGVGAFWLHRRASGRSLSPTRCSTLAQGRARNQPPLVHPIVGGTAWLGLATLAATSTDGMVRRLGGLRWRRLHQIVYAIALLALIHYFQQTKADVTVPHLRRQSVPVADGLSAYRLVAGRRRIVDADAAGDDNCRVDRYVRWRSDRHRHRLPCFAHARACCRLRFRCRHQARLGSARCRPRRCRSRSCSRWGKRAPRARAVAAE